MITRWWLTYSSSGDLSPSFEASPISPMGGWKFRLLCPISVDEIHLKPHVGNHLNTYIYENTILNHHWKMPTTILDGYPICGFPKIGVPRKIIHFFIGFSIINQPAIGVPPWKSPYLPVGQPFLHRHRPGHERVGQCIGGELDDVQGLLRLVLRQDPRNVNGKWWVNIWAMWLKQ